MSSANTLPTADIADALIVGAGPAGSHLAWLLACAGLRVILIDKAGFPRDKTCGGGLSPKTLALLDLELGLVAQCRVSGAILTWRNRDAVRADLGGQPAITVTRLEFDALLLERARAAGAAFHADTGFLNAEDHGDMLQVKTSRGFLRCRLLLGADGAASVVRARTFGRDVVRLAPALEALVTPANGMPQGLADSAVFDFGAMPGGYGWIFPKREHFNVGVYAAFGGASPRRQLDLLLAEYACLRRPAQVLSQGYVIPVDNPRGLYQRGRTWLVGDAAGLAETLFGEGIYFALKSAELAARAVLEQGLDSISPCYTRLLRRELLPELRAAQRMARLIYRHPRRAFEHLMLNRELHRDFAGVISGAISYRRCLLKTALRFPRWLLPSRAPKNGASL
jgi:geranylgeranyl reductase family protein